MALHMQQIKIIEVADGWRVLWGRDRVTRAQSAAQALRAVKRAGRRRAARGSSSALFVEWQPSTWLGRLAVQILQER